MTRMTTFAWFVAISAGLARPAEPVLAQDHQSARTYVIVHGAWSGVGSWLEVERLLASRGHRVYLAELTGHGERAHLQAATIDLHTHIMDVENLIRIRDLQEIYLVGHSYGGMVITGVWDRLRERIKHVVYVDAFLPEDGKAVADYQAPEGSGGPLKPGDLAAAPPTGFVSPAGTRGQLYPPTQSLRTFTQPLVLANGPLPSDTGRTYVRAVGKAAVVADPTFKQFAERVRDDPAWQYLEIAAGHRVQLQDPSGLVEILLSVQ